MAAEPALQGQERLDRLDPTSVTAPPSVEWCRAWTAAVDQALRVWLRDASLPSGVSVVALGSFGRRELCPGSDIDLLLLHDGWGRADLETLVQQLCYPLWDVGLSVGHAVRTPKEAIRAAGERIDTATALIDRRLVAGDPGPLDAFTARFERWLRRNGGALLTELSGADGARHARAGQYAGMLEPDLKNGAGGLRDLHSLGWAAACLLGECGLDPLVGARYLGAADRHELSDARGLLLAVRCALHLVHAAGERSPGGDLDRLRLDLQDDVAAELGYADADELLREVGLAERVVSHVHGRTWPRLVADGRRGRSRKRTAARSVGRDGIVLAEGLVELDPAVGMDDPVEWGWQAVAAAAVHATHLGRSTASRLRRDLLGKTSGPWTRRAREGLLTVLRRGRPGLPALADADHIGLLAASLPDWLRVRGLPQRNPYHRFDVDTHGAQTVAWLVELGEGVLDPRHAGLFTSLDDPESLLLGAWLHDIGKAWSGDHSIAGAVVAREWVLRMGFEQRRAHRVAAYVRLHLLLPDVATGRDLDDDDEIVALARRVGDAEALDALYLLSLADARATGPSAYSPWKDGLLATLHARARRVLTEDAPVRQYSREHVVAKARTQADPQAVNALVRGVPHRYLLAASPEQIAEHARLVAPPPRPGELRSRLRDGPIDGTIVLTVLAGDRRGLMADCAGVLAGHGVDVFDARAFTRADGVALDWFTLQPESGADWDRVSDDLRAAAAGELDVAALVERRERRRDQRRRADGPVPAVIISFERGPSTFRIEVRAADVPGLLYRLARTLADAGLDVVGAKVSTLGTVATDVFFVRRKGGPVDADDLRPRLQAAAAPPSHLGSST